MAKKNDGQAPMTPERLEQFQEDSRFLKPTGGDPDFLAGIRHAKAGKPLPNEASPLFRMGYELQLEEPPEE